MTKTDLSSTKTSLSSF